MSERTTISIPTDSDGFISRKCAACLKLFKAKYGEGSDKPLSHFPYCNAQGDDWFTDHQRAYVRAVGMNFARDIVSETFGEVARNFNRGQSRGGFITAKMTYRPSPKLPVPLVPVESNEPMPVIHFGCCNERVKHNGSAESLYCVICGSVTSPEVTA